MYLDLPPCWVHGAGALLANFQFIPPKLTCTGLKWFNCLTLLNFSDVIRSIGSNSDSESNFTEVIYSHLTSVSSSVQGTTHVWRSSSPCGDRLASTWWVSTPPRCSSWSSPGCPSGSTRMRAPPGSPWVRINRSLPPSSADFCQYRWSVDIFWARLQCMIEFVIEVIKCKKWRVQTQTCRIYMMTLWHHQSLWHHEGLYLSSMVLYVINQWMELKLTDWTHSGAEHLSDVMFYLLVHEENEV